VIGCGGGTGGAIRVVKAIDVGADHVRTAISRTLGLSAAEAEQLRRRAAGAGHDKLDGVRKVLNDATRHVTELLARDVLSAVRYHALTFRGPAPRRVELVGGDASDPQVRRVLGATLLLPVKPVDLFRGIDVSAIPAAHRTATLGEWAVALGLAMKRFPGPLERLTQPCEAPAPHENKSAATLKPMARGAAAAAAAAAPGGAS
jgi:cell division ATPase FtsA